MEIKLRWNEKSSNGHMIYLFRDSTGQDALYYRSRQFGDGSVKIDNNQQLQTALALYDKGLTLQQINSELNKVQ